jgi:cell division protein FtsQ
VREAVALAMRRPLTALVPPPRLRPHAAAALAALVVLIALYMLWFRDSGLVRVERVSVTGLTTSDAPRLRQALTASAQTMTTLHLDEDRLERAVAASPAVDRLELDPDFPHTLRIHVVENRPAALVVSGRSRMPVAGDGTLLRGLSADGSLPRIELNGPLPDERLRPGPALNAARVAGAAPAPLRRRLRDVRQTRDRGIVVRLRAGPAIVFGSARRVHAKWMAATRVLAHRSSRGASYVDVRLPERPAAGGLPAEAEQPAPPAPVQQPPAAPQAAQPQAAPPAQASPTGPEAPTPAPNPQP